MAFFHLEISARGTERKKAKEHKENILVSCCCFTLNNEHVCTQINIFKRHRDFTMCVCICNHLTNKVSVRAVRRMHWI